MGKLPKEAIDIKGTKQGLIILLDPNRDFEDIKTGLKNKMESSRGFFAGAKFSLHDEKKLFPAEKVELESICQQYGLVPNTNVHWPPVKNKHLRTEPTPPKSLPGEKTILVKQTLRSGQIINYPGHVTILGDIHPGAKVSASGNVILMGTCAGFIHAGNSGDTDAYIIALSMKCAQLKIADVLLIETPKNLEVHNPLIARIQQNKIALSEHINR